VLLYDDYGANAPNPADYSNTTTPACGPNAFGAPTGPSLVCNLSNLIAGNVSKYAFADDVHPTPYAHQQAAATAYSLIVKAGWQ
jgi:phospholipase/lecithinase/hemolysin